MSKAARLAEHRTAGEFQWRSLRPRVASVSVRGVRDDKSLLLLLLFVWKVPTSS